MRSEFAGLRLQLDYIFCQSSRPDTIFIFRRLARVCDTILAINQRCQLQARYRRIGARRCGQRRARRARRTPGGASYFAGLFELKARGKHKHLAVDCSGRRPNEMWTPLQRERDRPACRRRGAGISLGFGRRSRCATIVYDLFRQFLTIGARDAQKCNSQYSGGVGRGAGGGGRPSRARFLPRRYRAISRRRSASLFWNNSSKFRRKLLFQRTRCTRKADFYFNEPVSSRPPRPARAASRRRRRAAPNK
ncbi:hypothetical protein EVAR_46312_1 [Eumeta japonica]|uniref:Uncharacterized protein n=1 Tax=Eumeta variegata TaxID=151549 RepID=A0A4C1Y0S6_EUMVA|nr:hypothetical protein EVAR_46312_1 [Eumeta japonica]